MKGIAIGQSDFKALRVKDNYYIDKTMYIKDIIDNQSNVVLVTRPRRFGKTLNMSMLKYYFDCNQNYNKELFEGLKIMEQEEKYTSKLGYYPIIYITLKDVQDENYEKMLLDMKSAILEMYQEHRYLVDSDKIYPEEKENTIEETIENAKKQIEERKYEENLRERGFNNITKIVFAFKGKEVKMEVY